MATPDEPPIAWPDHPLAVSGGEILATRVLPRMGHNARDFAVAAAVCRGWRAACLAAAPTVSLYREMVLQPAEGEFGSSLAWSPCGNFLATTACHPPRLFIWRASTGALVNAWPLATAASDLSQAILENFVSIRVTFSRDGARAATHFVGVEHFAVWSVPDGRLLVALPGEPEGDWFRHSDFGVPGSASDGLLGFASDDGIVSLWDVETPPEGEGGSRPHQRSRWDLAPSSEFGNGGVYIAESFAFSPDGFKFVASFCEASSEACGVAYVYDVASLARLGVHSFTPQVRAHAAWAPDGRHVLLSGPNSAYVWDFSRPEAPPIATIDIGADSVFQCWSPSGASYIVSRKLKGRSRKGTVAGRQGAGQGAAATAATAAASAYAAASAASTSATTATRRGLRGVAAAPAAAAGEPKGRSPDAVTMVALEERRATDGMLLRALAVPYGRDGPIFPCVCMSPDAHALLLYSSVDTRVPARVIVLG